MARNGASDGTAVRRRSAALGLRQWQTLGVGAILALVSTLLLGIFSAALADQSFESLRQRGLSLARFLALAGEAPLAAGRGEDLQTLFDRIGGERDLVYAEIVDADGNVVAESGSAVRPADEFLGIRGASAGRAPAARADLVPATEGGPLYLFSVPVRRRGEERGPAPTAPGDRAPKGGGPTAGAPSAVAPSAAAPEGLGPRSASAAPRTRPASERLLGEVRLALSPAGLEETRRALLFKGSGLAALLVLGGVLLTRGLSRRLITDPAARLADVAARLDEVLEEIRASADLVVAGTLNQQESLRQISASAEAMSRTLRDVAASVGSLSSSSEETSTSILAMVSSIEEIAGHADGLTMSVNDTSATTEEMVASIKEIDRNVELLNQFVAETSGAMGQMGKTIQQVERNAADSKGISEIVARNAEKGMRAVELTIEGMEAIRGSVVDSSRAIESVGRRGQEIGLILNVLQEVTEQTNLLALNAAIIAAQAGEHGRGFAVVAEEIRQLADRSATSAKEIGTLITTFQSDTTRAVAAMQEGSRRVEEGSERSREAGRALKEILESARRSSTMVGEIAGATREQALGSQAISAAVEKVRDMVTHIKRATAEQNLGSEQIMSAVENMREMAGHVKRATVEQTKGSRLITEAIENVTEMVGSVHHQATEQSSASDQILRVLTGFVSVTQANLASATRMQEAMEVLRGRARSLREEIARFRSGA